MATQGVELAADDAASWYTLGVVHYAAGRWDAARVALEKSLKIQPEGSVSVWFLLAMTQWQLGDRAAAQRCYEQAVDVDGERTAQTIKISNVLRAEAAGLLGQNYACRCRG